MEVLSFTSHPPLCLEGMQNSHKKLNKTKKKRLGAKW